jgi:demethylmenaquinone methyltransferase/2-methoxy-6-polyprenyl-1,4-benzoquinol methylase
MVNKFYQEGEARASKVQDLFGTIAPRYDLINDLQSFGLHRWWKRRLIRMAQPRAGESALDICCGTGDITFSLARKGATAVGLDFSAPMLEVANRRAGSLPRSSDGSGKVSFMQGDALRLPFEDDSFDIVTVGYGLRNLADYRRGLGEMRRVAKPGGRILILDFGKPENQLWRSIYFGYLRCWVPLFGKLFCGDSQTHSYILESLEHYPAQKGVEAAMREMGCSNAITKNLVGGIMSINYGQK